MTRLSPGGVIGILGGGQLGRMTALAAARLGLRCRIYTPEENSPAAQVAAATVADYGDARALARFADAIDIATFEFENVPDAALDLLGARRPVRPRPEALRVSQDRAAEKRFLNDLGIPTARWTEVRGPDELASGPMPGILKSARFGYDGKGQVPLDGTADPVGAWRAMGGDRGVVEERVDFALEVSAVIARDPAGNVAAYDVVENRHRRGILHETLAPAPIAPALAAEARAAARRIAEALDLIGLLAVEFFVTRDGRLLANEIAPRPHNSGHWTMDACATDQFEQFVRAIAGLPLGDPGRRCNARMTNLLGDDFGAWPAILAEPGARLHLYGKAEARPGRKMGHVTRLSPETR